MFLKKKHKGFSLLSLTRLEIQYYLLIKKKKKIYFKEFETHPTTRIGKPKKIKYKEINVRSRQINKRNQLVYENIDHTVVVIIISVLGHKIDK